MYEPGAVNITYTEIQYQRFIIQQPPWFMLVCENETKLVPT
jgi:hypothetical protein